MDGILYTPGGYKYGKEFFFFTLSPASPFHPDHPLSWQPSSLFPRAPESTYTLDTEVENVLIKSRRLMFISVTLSPNLWRDHEMFYKVFFFFFARLAYFSLEEFSFAILISFFKNIADGIVGSGFFQPLLPSKIGSCSLTHLMGNMLRKAVLTW